jgi:hypothetical protein
MSLTCKTAAVVTLLALSAAATACGKGSSTAVSKPTTSASPSATTSPPLKVHKAKPAPVTRAFQSVLPVGAAGPNFFPFGSTQSYGNRISLLPPNAKDVDFSDISRAPSVGPFDPKEDDSSFRSWPSACELTSAAQLHGLFSAITGLDGKPQGGTGTVYGAPRKTPHDTTCKFYLNDTFDTSATETGEPSWVEITEADISSDAHQEYVQSRQVQKEEVKQYPEDYADYPSLPNGVSCFSGGFGVKCLKGYTFYWIWGQKVTDGSNDGTDQSDWIDQIEIPLAVKLGSELPA